MLLHTQTPMYLFSTYALSSKGRLISSNVLASHFPGLHLEKLMNLPSSVCAGTTNPRSLQKSARGDSSQVKTINVLLASYMKFDVVYVCNVLSVTRWSLSILNAIMTTQGSQFWNLLAGWTLEAEIITRKSVIYLESISPNLVIVGLGFLHICSL